MKKTEKKFIKKMLEEKGSMTVYVAVSLLTFIFVLTAIFLSSATTRKNQLRTLPQIKAAYEQELKQKNEIYEQKLEEYEQKQKELEEQSAEGN